MTESKRCTVEEENCQSQKGAQQCTIQREEKKMSKSKRCTVVQSRERKKKCQSQKGAQYCMIDTRKIKWSEKPFLMKKREREIEEQRKEVQNWTNLQNKSLISADRRTKPTLMLTILRPLSKSSTRDLSLPIFGIMIQHTRLCPFHGLTERCNLMIQA